MGILPILPLFFFVGYMAILFGLFYLIYTWVNKFIVLRQEQNDLLREIIKKMEPKAKEVNKVFWVGYRERLNSEYSL